MFHCPGPCTASFPMPPAALPGSSFSLPEWCVLVLRRGGCFAGMRQSPPSRGRSNKHWIRPASASTPASIRCAIRLPRIFWPKVRIFEPSNYCLGIAVCRQPGSTPTCIRTFVKRRARLIDCSCIHAPVVAATGSRAASRLMVLKRSSAKRTPNGRSRMTS
jgi:hypothetical protein